MKAATIKLFLVHGRPNGLRTAELSNWSGKAVAAPRTEISELLKREELLSPGFYLLTGVDPDSGDRAIYIGEAENVANRLKGHASKDFWNAVTVFVSLIHSWVSCVVLSPSSMSSITEVTLLRCLWISTR